ncbi:MAG: efflux RND transporter periplasmic adaptor subunit [Gemmatimonadaceae bacterium]|nr:efflux RND transporter periplasmic adaptor subunit [Gemmatimonadaceae bacterium]
MTGLPLKRRTLIVSVVGLTLFALFVFVAVRAGPLAPIAVTVTTVDAQPVSPTIFGVGTVESRYSYRIGPTTAGRVKRVLVEVGDRVAAGQLLSEIDAVDLEDRRQAQLATIRRSEAALGDVDARQRFAQTEERRYEQLLAARSTSEEILASKRQARQIADASLASAREELARTRAERDGLNAQLQNLRLIAPVAGLIVARDADPGTTVVAGQSVIELVDPRSLWVHVRFDQGNAEGLKAGLLANVVLRSRGEKPLPGRVLRREPRADAVTEEMLAKVTLTAMPDPLPSIGELAEVTVSLPTLPSSPVVPNAAVHRVNGTVGVWHVVNGDLQFTPVTIGAADLNGHVQVRTGLRVGDRIVVYSAKSLSARSRISIVDRIAGVAR